MKQIKAAVYNGKRIELKDVPKPRLKKNMVLISIKSVGTCGTDIAIVKGDLPVPVPLIVGHELSGEVIEVGSNVDQSWLGKRVTSEINSNIDFNCYFCSRKMFSQCISRKAIGIDIDGAFAEYIGVESYLLHEFPENISFQEATFIEPLAAAYQTFEMMPVEPDDKIMAIFGAGKLGLLLTQVAVLKGLDLIVIDGSDKKLALAKKFGAKTTFNRFKIKNPQEEIKKLTEGLGADIVVDTTGNPDSLKVIIDSCRTRGKLHIKSTHGLDAPIDLTDIVVRELTLYSSRCGPFKKAINGLRSGEINVRDLISKTYPLEQINDAIDSYGRNRDHIKTIILP